MKSVVVKIDPDSGDDDYIWTLNGEPMPVVAESMRVGVLRSANTESSAVNENIKKSLSTPRFSKIVSEYDQEIPQLQTADNPVALRGRATPPSRDTRKTN